MYKENRKNIGLSKKNLTLTLSVRVKVIFPIQEQFLCKKKMKNNEEDDK